MARSYLPGAGSGFAADRRTAFRPRDRLHLVLSMCGPFRISAFSIALSHRCHQMAPALKRLPTPTSIVVGEKMRIGTEGVGPSQGCRLGHGLRRVSLWADESGVSRLGLQYAVTLDLESLRYM